MTRNQKSIMFQALLAYPAWVRARRAGHRVTLASMHTKGLLERQARRGVAGEPNAAYEYRPTPAVVAMWEQVKIQATTETPVEVKPKFELPKGPRR